MAPTTSDASDDAVHPERQTASALRDIERRRLAALVARDIETARALHAIDYELITPSGRTLTRDEYLGDIASGALRYDVFEPASGIRVRVTGPVAILRYRATIRFPGGDPMSVWHTDYYESRDGSWRAVWSQATRAPDA